MKRKSCGGEERGEKKRGKKMSFKGHKWKCKKNIYKYEIFHIHLWSCYTSSPQLPDSNFFSQYSQSSCSIYGIFSR
jgi:hypothetical protein